MTSSDELRRLAGVLSALLRHRVLIVGLPVLALGVVIAQGLRKPQQYTSAARFTPQGATAPSPLAGLAVQFGVGNPASDRAQSPAFYTELLTSHTVLARVAAGAYSLRTEQGTVNGPLAHVLGLAAGDTTAANEAAVGYLRGAISTYVSPATGVITLGVRSRWPVLSYQLNRALFLELDRFNRETRQSQAAAERRFVEERFRVAGEELRAAEGRLQSFYQQNRAWENSPPLKFQQDRLARDVNLRGQVYASLAQSAEKARIDEVRDTPVLTVIEEPRIPLRPEPRGLGRRAVLAVILAGALAMLLAIVIDFARWRGADTAEEFLELEMLRREALQDLRRPWRPIGRILRPRASGHSSTRLGS